MLLLLAMGAQAANPTFESFDTNYFRTNQPFKIGIVTQAFAGLGGGSGQTNWPVNQVTNAGTAAYSNSGAFFLSKDGNGTNETVRSNLTVNVSETSGQPKEALVIHGPSGGTGLSLFMRSGTFRLTNSTTLDWIDFNSGLQMGQASGSTASIVLDDNAGLAKFTGLTASRLVTTGSGNVLASSTATDTEASYLSGVTSALQTQINGKQTSGNYITALTGDGTASGPGSTALTLKNTGTAGSYTKVTFDAQGRETSGTTADLSGADVTGTLAAGRFPALTGDVTTSAGSLATTLAAGSATVLNSGTLLAARMPALTGAITTSAGAVATSLGSFTSASLYGALTDETGSGSGTPLAVFNQSPTIVTPTIASFVNSTHNHQNAAGGGTLANAALQNSSIAVSGGSGISVSGSPVSLGGTVTITATGTIGGTSDIYFLGPTHGAYWTNSAGGALGDFRADTPDRITWDVANGYIQFLTNGNMFIGANYTEWGGGQTHLSGSDGSAYFANQNLVIGSDGALTIGSGPAKFTVDASGSETVAGKSYFTNAARFMGNISNDVLTASRVVVSDGGSTPALSSSTLTAAEATALHGLSPVPNTVFDTTQFGSANSVTSIISGAVLTNIVIQQNGATAFLRVTNPVGPNQGTAMLYATGTNGLLYLGTNNPTLTKGFINATSAVQIDVPAMNGAFVVQSNGNSYLAGVVKIGTGGLIVDKPNNALLMGSGCTLGWFSSANPDVGNSTSADTLIYRPAANTIQMAVNGTPSTQTFQSASGAFGSDRAGADFVLIAGPGSGTAKGGAYRVKTGVSATASSSTVNGSVERVYIASKETTLTESTATAVLTLVLANSKHCGIRLFATTHADDGTDFQSTVDEVLVSVVNKGGTLSIGTSTIGTAVTATVATDLAGTLTTTWTATASGTTLSVKNSAVSSLTQTTLKCRWRVEIDTDDTALAISPQ